MRAVALKISPTHTFYIRVLRLWNRMQYAIEFLLKKDITVGSIISKTFSFEREQEKSRA
jgi:hypothetical protein